MEPCVPLGYVPVFRYAQIAGRIGAQPKMPEGIQKAAGVAVFDKVEQVGYGIERHVQQYDTAGYGGPGETSPGQGLPQRRGQRV